MENGENTVEAGAPPCPLFTEPREREEGGETHEEGQLQFLPWEWTVPVGSPRKTCSQLEKWWPR